MDLVEPGNSFASSGQHAAGRIADGRLTRQSGALNLSYFASSATGLTRQRGVYGGLRPGPGYTLTDNVFMQQGAKNYTFEDLYKYDAEDDKISAGSYGTVYKCYHVNNPFQRYAVKIIERSNLKQKDNVAIFRETEILRELRNLDYVVRLIDFFQDEPEKPESKLYVVQVLAEGGDVFDRLGRKESYTEKDARDLAEILLTTVGHIHQKSIVHRDLKPDNLLLRYVDNDTSIMLADFGFARYVRDGERCRTRCGTPAFVAPEILIGQDYGLGVDFWSIGCLLYMLIGGYPPFQGANHRELFRKIRAGDFVFHDSVFGNVSISAKNLISHLLTVNPENRYTASLALGSDWFVKETPERLLRNDLSNKTLPGFQAFNKQWRARQRWKAATRIIVWAANQPFWEADKVTFSQQVSIWDEKAIDEQIMVSLPQQNDIADTTEPAPPVPSRPPRIAPNRDALLDGLRDHVSHRIPKQALQHIAVQCVKFADVYRLETQIRSGSTATVWKCVHIHSDEIYAVKVVDRQGLNPNDDENILTEVATMQSLSGNKYCVQLLDFYEEESAFYLVMEYMAGGDVFDRIVRLKTYTEKDARDLSKLLLKAVRAMHKAGIAHRDIKPQNLLLRSNENHIEVKVGDFGFSRRVHTPNSLTSRVGTPTYVAPEILKNIPHDERVDLWSVGVVIFVLLVGYPPFLEDNQAMLFENIRQGKWFFVEEDWRRISREARDLIRGLLKIDPKDRLTVDEALRSNWIKMNKLSLSNVSLGNSINKIRSQRKRLRAIAKTVIFLNRMNALVAQPMDVVEEQGNEDLSVFGSIFSSGTLSLDESMDLDSVVQVTP